MNRFSLITASLLALGSASAFAGGYVGLGQGITSSDVASENRENLGYNKSRDADTVSGGFKAYGGFTFGNWGVEAAYYDLGNYELKGQVAGVDSRDRFKSNAVAFSFVGNFKVAEKLKVHGRAGVADVETRYHCYDNCNNRLGDTSKKVFSPLIGGGFSWEFTPGWALRGDLDIIPLAKSHVGTGGSSYEKTVSYSLLSANIEYRF